VSKAGNAEKTAQIDLKICGITNAADLCLAARVGASFFGTIVEIARSPRSISVQQAAALAETAAIPQVCVMDTESPAAINAVVAVCHPAAVQLHCDADAAAGAVSRIRDDLADEVGLWIAVGLPPRDAAEGLPIPQAVGRIAELAAAGVARIVLDTRVAAGTGGTGMVSDWSAAAAIGAASPLPIMLAGGITPANVAQAVLTVKPQGIDVSSGVEREPGVKAPHKMAELADQFRKAVVRLQAEQA